MNMGAPQDNPLSEKSFSRRGLTRDIASMDRELEGISLQEVFSGTSATNKQRMVIVNLGMFSF